MTKTVAKNESSHAYEYSITIRHVLGWLVGWLVNVGWLHHGNMETFFATFALSLEKKCSSFLGRKGQPG
jgi:hypothetical protein